MSVKWNGDKVLSRMTRAEVKGINVTMGAAAEHAKNNHKWKSRTFELEASIGISTFARVRIRGVSGIWGSSDIAYALIHELGGTIRPKRARALFLRNEADEVFAVVQSVTIKARPYLRPAADAQYPALAKNIRKAFKRAA